MSIARPLYNLVKKDQNWNWAEKQEKVFRKLKKRFTKELVLTAPDLDKEIGMEVVVSDYAIEEILSIEYEDRK